MSKTGIWKREDLPDFAGQKVFVLNGAFFGNVVSMLARCGFQRSVTIEDADLVVFTGGEDINPKLYAQEPLRGTWFNDARDIVEEAAFHKAKKLNKPMFGICRGAQFLHAMNGGLLWQHVINHGRAHTITDIEEDIVVTASSMHHQMLQNNDRIQIIAVATEQVSTYFEDQNVMFDLNKKGCTITSEMEIEAGFYTDSKCLFVQGHPEVGPAPYTAWCMWKLHDWLSDLQPFQETMEDMIIKQIG